MVNSHNKTKQAIRYATKYLYISVAATFALLAYTYKDIIELRFGSGFFNEGQLTDKSKELFIDGFSANLSQDFSKFLPIVITLILAYIVAYSIYHTYKHTYRNLDVHHNFANAKKVPWINISLQNMVLYTLSFVLPLLFWSFYLIYWFPLIARIPLRYILGASSLKFAVVATLSLLLLILLTHIGQVFTRLTIGIFKVK